MLQDAPIGVTVHLSGLSEPHIHRLCALTWVSHTRRNSIRCTAAISTEKKEVNALASVVLKERLQVIVRVINVWNSLPADRVDFSSFAAFKQTIEQIDFSQFLFGYDN